MELVKDVPVEVPKGFAPFDGEDRARWRDASLQLENVRANIRENEAKVREHEVSLKLAQLQLTLLRPLEDQLTKAIVQTEMSLGINKPDDLVVKNGTYFRRINGNATEEAKQV